MSVVVTSTTVSDLFSGLPITASDGSTITGNLHLPEYQRPYRWNQEQINRLLSDLKKHFDTITTSQKRKHLFYLGSIILHQQAQGQRLNIIDGQQRLTTMALLAWVQQSGKQPELKYDSPFSQQQIRNNLKHLLTQQATCNAVDLAKINVTLVVTRNEDDAYRFFETQNTGGVRLSGPDIIKAHHLRATPRTSQNEYARTWESLRDLDSLVGAVLKARCWRSLDFQSLPSHRQPQQVRQAVVTELAERTDEGTSDTAYQHTVVIQAASGSMQISNPAPGYAMCQPLNAGVNAIHYLRYFDQLHHELLVEHTAPGLEHFYGFYKNVINEVEGCSYLKSLYDSALLLYASHFGREYFFESALWLFRVIYSPRVSNQKAVRESSVSAFVRNNPIFDWILMSYTPQQCLDRLRQFKVTVSPENLDRDSSVKKRFILAVADKKKGLGLDLHEDQLARHYDTALKHAICRLTQVQEEAHD